MGQRRLCGSWAVVWVIGDCISVSNSIRQQAISELPFASVSKRVQVQSLSYENVTCK